MPEQIMLFVASVFKGTTINKKMRLDYESLRHPETRILSSFEYKQRLIVLPIKLAQFD